MTANPRIIGPDELDTRDLVHDPFALECLSPRREGLLKRVEKLVTWRAVSGAGLETWAFAPSWANAVIDELGIDDRRQHEDAIVELLRRAHADEATRDAVIAAIEAGGGLVLRLALQQEAEVP